MCCTPLGEHGKRPCRLAIAGRAGRRHGRIEASSRSVSRNQRQSKEQLVLDEILRPDQPILDEQRLVHVWKRGRLIDAAHRRKPEPDANWKFHTPEAALTLQLNDGIQRREKGPSPLGISLETEIEAHGALFIEHGIEESRQLTEAEIALECQAACDGAPEVELIRQPGKHKRGRIPSYSRFCQTVRLLPAPSNVHERMPQDDRLIAIRAGRNQVDR